MQRLPGRRAPSPNLRRTALSLKDLAEDGGTMNLLSSSAQRQRPWERTLWVNPTLFRSDSIRP
jgi:hypothetical protein